MLKCAVFHYEAHSQVILVTVVGMVLDMLFSARKSEELENLPTLRKVKIFIEVINQAASTPVRPVRIPAVKRRLVAYTCIEPRSKMGFKMPRSRIQKRVCRYYCYTDSKKRIKN